MKNRLLTTALLVAGATSFLAAAGPFDGTWKLNVAKSRFAGDTFTYTTTPAGLMHYDNGKTWAFDFGLDGKPYPTPDAGLSTWTPQGDNQWLVEWKFGDRVTNRTLTTLAKDGKTLTFDSTDFRSDGTEGKELDVYKRVSGTAGLPGKWKNVKTQPTAALVILSEPAPGQFRFEEPAWKATSTGPTDGTPIPIIGPDTPKGWTVALTRTGPRSMKQTNRFGDKVMYEGTMTVSQDGNTLIGTSWVPGKEDEKTRSVYEKQNPPAWKANAAVEKELVAFEHRWAESLVKGDPTMIEGNLAKEFIFQAPHGVVSREEDLHGGSYGGDWKAQACQFDPYEVRVYGSTALVLGRYDMKCTYKGNAYTDKGLYTDVFVKRDGKWMCVLGQTTPAAKP